MERREYHNYDKSHPDWAEGPWKDEPDKVQWQDSETGMACLIVRNQLGVLCGYVGVPGEHPWHGKDYNEVDVAVHGGLTFAGPCSHGPEEHAICHVPGEGEPDDVWWLGFDCGHLYDRTNIRIPKALRDEGHFSWDEGRVYRDVSYVTEQVRRLAAQADAAALRPTAKAESV
jgi:hypothetical protein